MAYPVITDSTALAGFCDEVRDGSGYIAIDTEFLRDNTYWPQLCLVQIAGEKRAAAIDPLAPGLDLQPLFDLLADAGIVKVFHSARQDIEIFVHLTGVVPHPIYDTQVAAMVCGLGDQIGYENLLRALGIVDELDKASRFTDWAARPLTDRQIAYAMADVVHLRPAFEALKARVERQGRSAWIAEEMAILEARETYVVDPDQAWARLKLRGLKPQAIPVLQHLAAWREREAQRRDLPRNRLLKDETLIDLAAQAPTSPDKLARTRGLSKGMVEGWQGKALLQAIEAGLAVPKADWPRPPKRPDLPNDIGATVDLLKVLLKMECQIHGVAQRLVATADDLEQIAAFDDADVPAMRGWRYDVFGHRAAQLKEGRLALSLRGRDIVAFEVTPETPPVEAPVPSGPDQAASP